MCDPKVNVYSRANPVCDNNQNDTYSTYIMVSSTKSDITVQIAMFYK